MQGVGIQNGKGLHMPSKSSTCYSSAFKTMKKKVSKRKSRIQKTRFLIQLKGIPRIIGKANSRTVCFKTDKLSDGTYAIVTHLSEFRDT